MPATDTRLLFGGSHGGVVLPYRIPEQRTGTVKCQITLHTRHPRAQDVEEWHNIYRYAAAVTKLCVSARGKPGSAYGLGERGDLYVDIRVCAAGGYDDDGCL